jgi:DNA-binding NarL/FixJ family response regulator
VTWTVRSPADADGGAAAPDRRIRVLVVDDSLVFRTGMTRAVQACPEMELLGEADGGEAALEAIDRLAPDLVILDLLMPDLDAFGVLRALHARQSPPECRILVISATLDDQVERDLLAAGADACMSKASSRASICDEALRLLAQ